MRCIREYIQPWLSGGSLEYSGKPHSLLSGYACSRLLCWSLKVTTSEHILVRCCLCRTHGAAEEIPSVYSRRKRTAALTHRGTTLSQFPRTLHKLHQDQAEESQIYATLQVNTSLPIPGHWVRKETLVAGGELEIFVGDAGRGEISSPTLPDVKTCGVELLVNHLFQLGSVLMGKCKW